MKLHSDVCALACALSLGADAAVTGLSADHLANPGHLGANPSFSWRMETPRKGARQTAYRVRVSLAPRNGVAEAVWDSDEVREARSVGIAYAGKPLSSARRYEWTVGVKDERGCWTESEPAYFCTGLLRENEWNGANWIEPVADGEYGLRTGCFRRVLANDKDVTEAWWTVAAAGVFEMYANGQPVTDEFLKPGFTHPLKVRQACTYDVTDAIDCHAGATNVFAVAVSAGWSRDKISCRCRPGRRPDPSLAPALRSVIFMRHADGTETRICTDGGWQAEMDRHPVRIAGIYEGETVDARESLDWLYGGDPDWHSAKANVDFCGEVRSFRGPPVRLREDLSMRPKSAWIVAGAVGASEDRHGAARVVRRFDDAFFDSVRIEPGEMLVCDFGQNASAVSEVCLEGERGTCVEMRHAEMLNDGDGLKSRGNDGPGGTPYLANLRTSFAGAKYVCRGGGVERYRPTFTFFGFRYASVTADSPIIVREIRSVPVTSVGRECDTVEFKTDNPLVNRLFENCRWGMYSNYLSVPTDCPQRDERVGWTADAQVFAPAAAYLADTYAFLAKWMADMRDSQRPDGCFPWVAPETTAPGYTIGWTDAGVVVPYVLWRRFGDVAVVRENWESMNRYMEYVAARGGDDPQPFGDWLSYEYGADMDWLSPSRVHKHLPRKRFLDFAYRVWTDRMMAEMADALGEGSAAMRYRGREVSDLAAFRASCLASDGTIRPDCSGQCSALYALLLDLLPGKEAREATRRSLREDFRAHGERLQTGFLGTAILLDAVTRGMGDSELAYTLLLQDENPSWLYSVNQGATTIWERWNSYTKERGFGPVAMNSFNHYAYGVVAGWMMSTMAGIRDDSTDPGFRHFTLAPIPDARIGMVDATFRSPYGTITSNWRYEEGGGWRWRFTIPPNTTATVFAPGQQAKEYIAGAYEMRLPHVR